MAREEESMREMSIEKPESILFRTADLISRRTNETALIIYKKHLSSKERKKFKIGENWGAKQINQISRTNSTDYYTKDLLLLQGVWRRCY
jgi:hypothetical protein